jgi:type IV pilus assembly protein PilN
MLEINLLPVREARRKEEVRQFLLQLVLALLVACSGIGFTHRAMSNNLSVSNARILQMQHDIDQFKPRLEQVAEFRKKKSELKKKIGVIEGLDRARSGPARIFSELAERTPDRLWITSLTSEKKMLFMKGQSLDNDLVAEFMRNLGDSPYFSEVDLDQTTMGSSKTGLRIVNFTIRAKLRQPKKDEQAKPKST